MKDLFDELYNHLKPHFEKFEKYEEDLKQDIKRGIINDLMNCTTIEAVAEIEARDAVYFEMWPELLANAESARNRIRGLFKVQVDAYGLEMLN